MLQVTVAYSPAPRLVRDRLWNLCKQSGYCLWREGRSPEARVLLLRALRLQPLRARPLLYWLASFFLRPREPGG